MVSGSNVITNAMTVDVEDYFQVSAFEKVIARQDWETISPRVGRNTERVLDIFSEYGVKATFFTLGWVAERFPQTIRRMVDEGHELASHGWSHVRATRQQPAEFREDITRTKKLLEDISGVRVRGYRAASYSIGANNLWALDELHGAGYDYSSSIFPGKHDLYGMPDAPRFSFKPRGADGIVEIPVTTVAVFGRNFPAAGGGFFRLYPYALSRWALRRVNQHDGHPGMFYFHPWEIDPGQPRQQNIPLRTRVRHYLNLERMEARLRRLLGDFSWSRMDDVFLRDIVAPAISPESTQVTRTRHG
jgi:polysaccharide deacetylase family protein (PEP-CTERM system associated)